MMHGTAALTSIHMTYRMYEYANQTVRSSRRCASSSSAPPTPWVQFVIVTATPTDEVNNWCLSFACDGAEPFFTSHPSEDMAIPFQWVSNLLFKPSASLPNPICVFSKQVKAYLPLNSVATVSPLFFGTCSDKHEFPPGVAEAANFSSALLFCPARSPIKTQKTRPGLRWFPSPLLGTGAHMHWSWTSLKRVASDNNWTPENRIGFLFLHPENRAFPGGNALERHKHPFNDWEGENGGESSGGSACVYVQCECIRILFTWWLRLNSCSQLIQLFFGFCFFSNWQQICRSGPSSATVKTSKSNSNRHL